MVWCYTVPLLGDFASDFSLRAPFLGDTSVGCSAVPIMGLRSTLILVLGPPTVWLADDRLAQTRSSLPRVELIATHLAGDFFALAGTSLPKLGLIIVRLAGDFLAWTGASLQCALLATSLPRLGHPA